MLNLYKEVALQAAPPSSRYVVECDLQKGTVSAKQSQAPRRTEGEYLKTHIASTGGVHFKADRKSTPASYAWKVANDDRTLHIQPADLTRPEQGAPEACTTWQFKFSDPIREHTVGFSDAIEEDSLEVFVCTVKNQLYHLAIPSSAFSSANGSEFNISHWHRTIDVSSLTIDTLFRLQVHSANELFLCFTSGKIQYLTRKTGTHRWEGTTYDDKTWGASFNSLLGRGISRKLEYGSTYVDSRAAQAVQASADSTYLYTVCLNHQLRVWHIPSGRLAIAKDLVDYEGDDQSRTLSAFDRGHIQHLQGVEMRGSILVTYSPRDGGQFKFWDVRGGLTDTLTVSDRYPGVKLTPPDPDPTGTTVWSMVGFRLIPQGELDARGSAQLWILWGNNNHHKVYSLQFELDDIGRAWPEQNWVSSVSTSAVDTTPNVVSSGPEDATSQWLEYLTTPRRYPTEVLETALSIYTRNSRTTTDANWPLQRRLCDAIAPNARPKKLDVGGMNFDAFSHEVDQAWRTFHRTVEKINDSRRGPLALVFDSEKHLPLLVMTDEIAILRECDGLDIALNNNPHDLEHLEAACSGRWPHRQALSEERGVPYGDLAQLLSSALRFADDLPSDLVHDLDATISDLLYLNPERPLTSALSDIYDEVNFGEGISDDTFNRLESNLKPLGGIELLNNNLVLAAIGLLPPATPLTPGDHTLANTFLGSQILSVDVLDTLLSIRRMLWSLTALVIFEEGEFNQEEGSRVPNFDAARLFTNIAPTLKTLERNIWLANHFRDTTVRARPNGPLAETRVSILQDSLLNVMRPVHDASQPATYMLMAQVHEALDYISQEDPGYDNATVGLFCDMLKKDEVQLATDFARFLPTTPWATYMRGRLALARQQHDRAEQYFHQAAFGLAHGKASQSLVLSSFGFIKEDESDSFYNGLPRYFQHILALFQEAEAHTQSAHFARRTLQALTADQRIAVPRFRSETLQHLFNANLKLRRFRDAFDTLAQFTDADQSKLGAAALINSVLDTGTTAYTTRDAVNTLQSFPWALHPSLASELDRQLNLLAGRQKSITTTTSGTASYSSNNNVDYLQIVHALRIAQGDLRGAVSALYDRFRLVQRQGKSRSDPHATAIRHALLALINLMTCVPSEDAYIITEAEENENGSNTRRGGSQQRGGSALDIPDGVDGQGDGAQSDKPKKKRRRIIVTLADLRRQYQHVLDRCARVERGDFGFSDDEGGSSDDDERDDGGEAMQIDGGGGISRLELTILPNGGGGGGSRGGGVLAEGGSLLAAAY